MRILFTRFPLESTFGGAEIQTLSLMEGLLERGHAVAFVGSCQTLLKECRNRHIPAIEMDIGKPPVTKWGAISFLWRKQRMKRKLEAMFDGFSDATGYGLRATGNMNNAKLEAQSSKLEALCMLSLSEKLLLTDYAAKRGTKVCWIEHDRVGRWLTQNPWLPLLKEQGRHATIIPVSHLSGKIYEEMGFDAKNIVPIPNGIDEKRLRATGYGLWAKQVTRRQQPEARSHRLTLACISRLSPEKGVDVLIEAMANVPEYIHLEIIGSGKEESTLKKLTRDLALKDRITFIPHEKNVAAVYKRSDALILPSRDNDPFGLVAGEAMMMGLPVIVTDQCGIAGYLADGKDALIARADDPASLTTCIEQLTDETVRKKLASNAAKTAKEKFSTSCMVERYEDVFTMNSNPSYS